MSIVVAARNDTNGQQRLAAAAREAGIFCNVADSPSLSVESPFSDYLRRWQVDKLDTRSHRTLGKAEMFDRLTFSFEQTAEDATEWKSGC